MSREKKTYEILCFYCLKYFEFSAYDVGDINRAYCDNPECVKKHAENKKTAGKRYKTYKKYCEHEMGRLHPTCYAFEAVLQIRGGKLYRESSILLGEIIHKDETFVFVQKESFGEVCLYRQECIIQ
ncbi:MAG: hypothetical protein HY764_03680 [Candidatus Portnoybacteria bacterium]|nr:hypothetical protein [Candidatus Portnoybacteria bacterium]